MSERLRFSVGERLQLQQEQRRSRLRHVTARQKREDIARETALAEEERRRIAEERQEELGERGFEFEGKVIHTPTVSTTTKKGFRVFRARLHSQFVEKFGREPTRDEMSRLIDVAAKQKEARGESVMSTPKVAGVQFTAQPQTREEMVAQSLYFKAHGKAPGMQPKLIQLSETQKEQILKEQQKEAIRQYFTPTLAESKEQFTKRYVAGFDPVPTRTKGWEEITVKEYTQSTDKWYYETRRSAEDGKVRYFRKYDPTGKTYANLQAQLSSRMYGKAFGDLPTSQQERVREESRLILKAVEVESEKFKGFAPISTLHRITTEPSEYLGIKTVAGTVVHFAQPLVKGEGIGESAKLVYAEEYFQRAKTVMDIRLGQTTEKHIVKEIKEEKGLVPIGKWGKIQASRSLAEVEIPKPIQKAVGTGLFYGVMITAATGTGVIPYAIKRGGETIRMVSPTLAPKILGGTRMIVGGAITTYGTKEMYETAPKISKVPGAGYRFGSGAILVGVGMIEAAHMGKRVWHKRQLEKSIQKLSPTKRAEYEKYMGALKKISGTKTQVKEISMRGMKRVPPKARDPIELFVRKEGDLIGGSVAQRTQTYGQKLSRFGESDVDIYTLKGVKTQVEKLAAILKGAGIKRVSIIHQKTGSYITIAGKKAVEYHSMQRFEMNLREVSWFRRGVRTTPSGTKVMDIEIQAQRKVVAAFTGGRKGFKLVEGKMLPSWKVDIKDYKSIVKSMMKTTEYTSRRQPFRALQLKRIKESQDILSGKTKVEPFMKAISREVKGFVTSRKKGAITFGTYEKAITISDLEKLPTTTKTINPPLPAPYQMPKVTQFPELIPAPEEEIRKPTTFEEQVQIPYPLLAPPIAEIPYPEDEKIADVPPPSEVVGEPYPEPYEEPGEVIPPKIIPALAPITRPPIAAMPFEKRLLKEPIKRKERRMITKGSFIVQIKERGVFKTFGKPMSRQDAMDFGSEIVDNSAAVTFKLVPSAKPPQRVKVKRGYFADNQSKFRTFMFKRKEKIPLTMTWIEKQGRARIDTPGEKRGISAKGWMAERLKKPAAIRPASRKLPTFKPTGFVPFREQQPRDILRRFIG